MNSQNVQSLQADLMSWENTHRVDLHELTSDFKANGFWHVNGERKGGTLRRKGTGEPMAYFLVTHPAGEPPFNKPTEVRLETRDGMAVTGWVHKFTYRKDAGEQGLCSESQFDGNRCEKRRFWKTLCREHANEAGYEITDDGRICAGNRGNGQPCTYRAKVNGYCAQHGGGSAPREKTTCLYEFPIYDLAITKGDI